MVTKGIRGVVIIKPDDQTIADNVLTIAQKKAQKKQKTADVPFGRFPVHAAPGSLSKGVKGKRQGGDCFALSGLTALLFVFAMVIDYSMV